ncbi:MAG: amidohydrolase family protein [Gammaproteobacteria bacterium]|nr:amidohydrolase family protein [Gammaproteobacteria bacterium]
MDPARRVITDGAVAICGNRIAAVGKRTELEGVFTARRTVDARRFMLTPGFVNGHVHITGDPLTRGSMPDHVDGDFAEVLSRWVIPRFLAHTEDDEHLSARLAAVQMLRTGTTSFIEAGTIRFLDAVVAGLEQAGIRGRVGCWVEGRVAGDRAAQTTAIDEAIRMLEQEVARYPASSGARIAAWPILIGHSTNPDEIWKCAKSLADANHLGVSAHMSPAAADPEWYLKNAGCRPVEHLAALGVLGSNLCLTHVVHVSDREMQLLADSGTNVIFCPSAALKGAFGVTVSGRYPEMRAMGVNIGLGTDGFGSDLMREVGCVAALFKDVRRDTEIFPAGDVLAMGILNGARAMGLSHEIGSLEAGRKADLVLHDLDRPEWRPLLNAVNHLVWCADGRGVHSVWVDGRQVVDDFRCTTVDEEELYVRAQHAGEAIIKRVGLPQVSGWPVE